MSWPSPSPELVALLDEGLAPFPCQKRMMFGGPAYFVNELVDAGQARAFEPMPGRPMREYVTLAEAVTEDPNELAEWLGRSFEFAASLPAKEAKARKAPKASRG